MIIGGACSWGIFVDRHSLGSAPDLRATLKFSAEHIWRSKWLVAGATIAAVVLTLVFYHPKPPDAWIGQTTITIGEAPPVSFIVQLSGPALAPLEPPRALVARISDQRFKERVADRTSFDPDTAAFSKRMLTASLRGVALDGDRMVRVELSAGSPADVRSALKAVAEETSSIHAALLDRSLAPLRARIDDSKARVAAIEKANDDLNARILNMDAGGSPRPSPTILSLAATAALPAWNTLKDRIQIDENLAASSEATVAQPALEISPVASRALGTLTASIIAGLVMLLAICLLAAAIGPWPRLADRTTEIDARP
ncbi:hypothetical protein [Bradyrhizobium sp. 187]|uniref:hypothetical protein n=1 Tax=Bradyrhizobium sp. 187 TaxID=2782655 RepID=UPI0020004422|nr:hypothetical protein [Bradyrhizobium sp. 187]UPJ70883.1 hypothetical protein IVB19_24815 [Bradyrhizobium sp. 187]